jgi:hypothetical protein
MPDTQDKTDKEKVREFVNKAKETGKPVGLEEFAAHVCCCYRSVETWSELSQLLIELFERVIFAESLQKRMMYGVFIKQLFIMLGKNDTTDPMILGHRVAAWWEEEGLPAYKKGAHLVLVNQANTLEGLLEVLRAIKEKQEGE